MKKYRRISLLALCLILLLSTFVGCGGKTNQETAADNPTGENAASPITVSDTLSYSNGSTTLHFTYDESGNWHWRDDPAFPLDQSYILSILDTVKTMAAAQPIPDATDPAAYGLDAKDKYLTTTGKNGEKVTFYFGSTAESGAYYMMRDDVEGKIYEAPVVLTEQLNRVIFDMMILPKFPQLTAENVHSIAVQGANGVSFTLEKQADNTWRSGDATVDSQIVLSLLTEMASMHVQSAIDYRPSAGVTGLCGLDAPAAVLSVAYVNTVGVDNTMTLRIGGVRGEGHYALIGEDTTIYLIPSAQLTQLLTLAEQGI